MALERKVNPFLRVTTPTVIKSAEHKTGKSIKNPVEVFSIIREWKNNA